jgi:RimJ/RimL family protein N-acetyltransferase
MTPHHTYINSYKAPEEPLLLPGYYGPDPYDINWIMPLGPLHQATLESERVKLTPFVPSLHAKKYAEEIAAHPELQRYFPFNPTTLDEILTEIELKVRQDPTSILFAIIDKAAPDAGGDGEGEGGETFVGMVALVNALPPNLSITVSWVMVFPERQRTHVASNAIGLLLRYCLELPEGHHPEPEPERGRGRPVVGLGLRRVQWISHTANVASHVIARRMGFREEAVMRWTYVIPEGVEGNEGMWPREGDPKWPSPGRHSLIFSMCADDWEGGGREHVQRMIDRRS